MCKSIRKFKCGTCESCYSSKRNSLAIRLKEHYKGYLRHFEKNQSAILFGMLTFDDAHLPRIEYNADVVCNWQPSAQSYLKRLNKLYPFLKFEYFISAEVGKQGRLHLHPLWFVAPRDVVPCYKGANLQRFHEMLSALSDKSIYNVQLLHSSSKKRKEIVDFTAFEKYVHDLLLLNWDCGLSECKPVLSPKAIVYITKYMTKSRDIIFRRRVWLSDDATRKSTHFVYQNDPFRKSRVTIGYAEDTSSRFSVPLIADVPRQRKRFFKYIYKSYLLSRGIGDYFYETPQWLSLLSNFQLDKKKLKLDSNHEYEIFFTPTLKWYDETHEHNTLNNGYSLPLKYRHHLYDSIAPKDTLERDFISSAGLAKLLYHHVSRLVSLCQSNNISYEIHSYGHDSPPDIIIDPAGWKKLNEMQLSNYNAISRFKQFLNEN